MADLSVSRVRIASALLQSILSASSRMFISPFKGNKGASNYFKDVVFASVRTRWAVFDNAADRYMNESTSLLYEKYCEQHEFSPETITLPSGTKAHWLGNPSAKKVLVYFHGGGYVLPCSPGHLLWLGDMQRSLGSDFSILLAYDLAPEHPFPAQLTQAVEFLRYLVETEGRHPSDLILGGDSAGANLILGLFSHICHPHPELPVLTLPSKIHACLLISPWVSLTNTHTPSFSTNAERDIFEGSTLTRWSSAFLGSDSPFAGNFYNEAVLAASEWWEPVADIVDEVLIWAGDHEVLKDGIEAFSKKFTIGFGGKGGHVNTIFTPKAAHDEMIVERSIGYKEDSGTGSVKVVQDWVKLKAKL